MTVKIPLPHPDPEVDESRGYITAVVRALALRGTAIDHVWLDPSLPVDATIRAGEEALVWNETQGWAIGEFVSGEQGVRTVLADPLLLGGGVLPSPDEIASRTILRQSKPLVTRQIRARDGFQETLRSFDPPREPRRPVPVPNRLLEWPTLCQGLRERPSTYRLVA
ncbi:hypothetical protein GCM10010439_16920 [Actinocorallia aurantiaca]|uniref:DUF6292 domain-containing protein n=1 Tax=Actinocorallia aurantiaca TaxID=46204 RepID=A0ABN3U1N7_9ACTN